MCCLVCDCSVLLYASASYHSFPLLPLHLFSFPSHHLRRENTVFHWHFLGADFATPEARENAVTRGSDCCGAGVYFSFWINQDTFVDVDEWAALLRRVLTTSNVNAALAKAG